jgi:hypothetical protein
MTQSLHKKNHRPQKSDQLSRALRRQMIRALKKIDPVAPVRREGDDWALIGGVKFPAGAVDELLRSGLAEPVSPTHLRVTAPGQLFLKRAQAATGGRGKQAAASQDAFRRQHQLITPQTLKAPDGERRKFARNRGESPLGWLARRKDKSGRPLINEDQFAAGERLREDFEMAHLARRITARWNGMPISERPAAFRGMDPTTAQIAARQRLNKALDAVGPHLREVLVRVCCHLEGLEQTERDFGWPLRSGKVVLAIALDRLVDFYDRRR